MMIQPQGNLSNIFLAWQFSGDRDLVHRLEQLPYRLQAEALEPAVAEIADEVAADAAGRAPVDLGLLAQSIGRSAVKKYGGGAHGVLYAAVGPRRGFRRAFVPSTRGGYRLLGKKASEAVPKDSGASFRDPVRYAHLVEGGRQAVKARPGHVLYSQTLGRFFRSAKAAPPKPFMAPAREDAAAGAMGQIEAHVSQFLYAHPNL